MAESLNTKAVQKFMPDKKVYVIAGPNGSGKTTFAKEFLSEVKLPFVNADEIALSLSPKSLEKVRVKAGKLFLQKIEQLIAKNSSFIVETTLAGKYFIGILNKLKENGYKTEIIYRHKAGSWQLFLNSKDEFLQVAVGVSKEIEIINEAGFALFRRMV